MKRVKLYSYILLLANFVLLAHSFVPHTHNHELTVYEIEQIAGKGVADCHCQSCETFVRILETTSSQKNDAENCNCCKHGKNNCFISVGYYPQANDDSSLTLFTNYFFIVPQIFDIPKPEDFVEYIYVEKNVSIPKFLPIAGLNTRAPPVLFS